METTLIGIDCAAQPINVGLARARWSARHTLVEEVWHGKAGDDVADVLAGWIRHRIAQAHRVLLALDAPLGWPDPLRAALPDHRAGERLTNTGPELFRRETDYVVRQRFGLMPLAVAADRIAWTSYAALRLLDELRTATGEAVPLAWRNDFAGVQAIEVYPAATRRSHGLPAAREEDCEALHGEIVTRGIRFPRGFTLCEASDHVRDAVLCLLAAADFLTGDAEGPSEDGSTALREGWIWVKRRAG